MSKVPLQGRLIGAQPRIRLLRSFDERSHSYLGYALFVRGSLADEGGDFWLGVGQGTHAKHQFEVGGEIAALASPLPDPRREIVDFYKASQLRYTAPSRSAEEPPPWYGVPPGLPLYRERGHRRLSARTYNAVCYRCIWGCHMAVEMIVDQWRPEQRRYRTETFCYGPKSCCHYRPGPTRKVPGRRGMTWEEPDWVDEDATAHRDPDG